LRAKGFSNDAVTEREFLYLYVNRPLGLLDTIITTKVYSKSSFHIDGTLKGGGALISTIARKIDRDIDRNVVFLEEIK
jgi:hypothetical protein